jgi:hypothetical protein
MNASTIMAWVKLQPCMRQMQKAFPLGSQQPLMQAAISVGGRYEHQRQLMIDAFNTIVQGICNLHDVHLTWREHIVHSGGPKYETIV